VWLIMLAIAVAGIRITARAQIGMATVEYLILIVFSAAGLLAVLGHRAGTFPVTRGWFSLSGIGGHGSLAAGLLIAVYTFSLRDGTVYVNEEVKHRRENPGKAAIYAVALLTVLYTLAQVGPQGLVSPARLQAKASTAMVDVATALGGTGWAGLMALAIALSVIAATGTGIVLTSRIIYGMASYRTLPLLLGRVSPPVQDPGRRKRGGRHAYRRRDVGLYPGDVRAGHLRRGGEPGGPAGRCVLTALATIAYYRRRVFSNVLDAVILGVLPLAAGFLGWIIVKSVQNEPASQRWSLAGIAAVGIIVMGYARFVLRSAFFQTPRESA
jgi:Amino acid permease